MNMKRMIGRTSSIRRSEWEPRTPVLLRSPRTRGPRRPRVPRRRRSRISARRSNAVRRERRDGSGDQHGWREGLVEGPGHLKTFRPNEIRSRHGSGWGFLRYYNFTGCDRCRTRQRLGDERPLFLWTRLSQRLRTQKSSCWVAGQLDVLSLFFHFEASSFLPTKP